MVYRYLVYASNSFGESPGSLPVSICAGLPPPWMHQDVGAVSAAGSANFDGNVFMLEGAGAGFGGTNDQFQFAFLPFNGDGTMVARFVPQTSSQFSQFGLMMRAAQTANAAGVALLISSEAGRNVEAPGWQAQLTVRESLGAATTICAASERFSEPMVTFGRLTGYCWLKLLRVGNRFTASFSSDGKAWTAVGSTTIALKQKLVAGLGASSRSPSITTTVWFDNVGATNSAFTMNSSQNQIESVAGLRAVKRSTNP